MIQKIRYFYDVDSSICKGKILKFIYKNRCEVTAFLIVFIIHIIALVPMKAPMIIDEYLTFSDAVFISGKYNWTAAYSSIPNVGYYGYGLSLFYSLLVWLPLNIYLVFKLSLVVNAIFLSMIPVILIKVTRKVTKTENKNTILLFIGILIGVFPPYIVLSNGVFNEPMLLFMPWAIVYIMVNMLNEDLSKLKIGGYSICLGIILVYMYALNARGLVAVIACVITLFYVYFILKKKMVNWFLLLGTFFAFLVLNNIYKNILIENLIGDNGGIVQNAGFGSLKELFSMMNFETICMALKTFFNNIFYTISVSFGIIIIAIVGCIFVLFRSMNRKKLESIFSDKGLCVVCFSIFNFLGTMGMLFLVTFDKLLVRDVTRKDYLMYGRYIDSAIPMLIFVALVILLKENKEYNKILKMAYMLLPVMLLIEIFVSSQYLYGDKYFQPLNAGAIFAFGGDGFADDTKMVNFVIMSIIVLTVFVFSVVMFKLKKIKTVLVIFTGLYIFSGFYTMLTYAWPTSRYQYSKVQNYAECFSDINDLPEVYKKVYSFANTRTWRGINIQYAIPDFEVTQLSSFLYGYKELDKVEMNSFIVSEEDENLEYYMKDCYKVQNQQGLYLWVYGKELAAELNNRGYTLICAEEEVINGTDLNLMDNYELKKDEGTWSWSLPEGLEKGSYVIEIIGEGLDQVSVECRSSGNKQIGTLETSIVNYSNHKEIIYNIQEDTGKLEFIIKTLIDDKLRIKNIFINEKETSKKLYEFTDTNSTLVVNSGCFSFGPYLTLWQGEYEVEMYGENLDKATFDISYEAGKNVSVPSDFNNFSSDLVSFNVEIGMLVKDIEFRVYNNTGIPISIDKIEVRKSGGKFQFGHMSNSLYDSMTIIDFPSQYDRLNLTGSYNIGESIVYLAKDSQAIVDKLNLSPGSYQISLIGEDIDVEMCIKDNSGKEIHKFNVTSPDENSVKSIYINDEIIDGKLYIKSKATSKFMTADNTGIVKIQLLKINKVF